MVTEFIKRDKNLSSGLGRRLAGKDPGHKFLYTHVQEETPKVLAGSSLSEAKVICRQAENSEDV